MMEHQIRMSSGKHHLFYTWITCFADRMCAPSRVSFLPRFSNAGYQKKAIFLKPVVKSVVSSLCYELCLLFGICFLLFFSEAGYQFKGKILKPGEKLFLGVQLKVK